MRLVLVTDHELPIFNTLGSKNNDRWSFIGLSHGVRVLTDYQEGWIQRTLPYCGGSIDNFAGET